MNNPLELLLRKQKMAQGGRIGFFGGGGADMGDPDRAGEREARGYGAEGSGSGGYNNNSGNTSNNGGGSHGGNDPQSISAQQMMSAEPDDYGGFNPNIGGGGPNQQPAPTLNFNIHEDQTITPTVDVTPEVKEESFLDKIFGSMFTKKTAKQNFVDKVSQNPRLSKFVKDTYGITSLDDITEAQVNEINDLNNLSFNEIQDYVSKLTGQAIDDPLGTGYNALTGSVLGFQGIGTLGMMNALANIAMDKPSYAMNPKNYSFTGPMVDAEGNLVSQDFSYTGPMSTNPAVNQQIADIQSISGVTGLTESQMAQAAAQAMTEAETGGKFSMGGGNKDDGVLNQQQNTEQQTIQNYMDGLTQSELDRYNQLIAQGYNDEYARAYLGML